MNEPSTENNLVNDLGAYANRLLPRISPYLLYVLFYLLNILLLSLSSFDVKLDEISALGMVVLLYFGSLSLFAVYSFFAIFRAITFIEYGADIYTVSEEIANIPTNETRITEGSPFTKVLRELLSTYNLQIVSAKKSIRIYKFAGAFFTVTASVIPVITWLLALEHFLSETKLPNLWVLTLSSMGAGGIGLTVGVTLLRHARNLEKALEEIERRLQHSRRQLAVLSSDDFTEEKMGEIREEVARILISESSPEVHESKEESDAKEMMKAAVVRFLSMNPTG